MNKYVKPWIIKKYRGAVQFCFLDESLKIETESPSFVPVKQRLKVQFLAIYDSHVYVRAQFISSR